VGVAADFYLPAGSFYRAGLDENLKPDAVVREEALFKT